MPFQPGQSGNPAGRPRGARNKATVLIEALVESDGYALVHQLMDQAKAGNIRILARLMDFILPKRKGAPIEIDLPPLEKASNAPVAIASVISAVGAGDLTPEEGLLLTRMIEAFMRASHKIQRLARNAERRANVSAAKRAVPAEPRVSRQAQAPSSGPIVPAAIRPNSAGEARAQSPAAEQAQALHEERSGRILPRLRQEALSNTSALAQSPVGGAPIVSPLLIPPGSTAEAAQAGGAHCIPIVDPRTSRSAREKARAAALHSRMIALSTAVQESGLPPSLSTSSTIVCRGSTGARYASTCIPRICGRAARPSSVSGEAAGS
jgi:hypothetical protein